MNTSSHAPLSLGFYDPHTHRSVVGYQPNGSPIWLTWRDGSVVLVGETGAGRTYLLNAMVRGMEQDADVTTCNIANEGTDVAIGKLRAIADSFGGTTPKRPRLIIVHAVEAVTGDRKGDLWDAAHLIARLGRANNAAVLISAQGASYVPRVVLGTVATTVALRQRSDRHVDALPEGMHAAVRAGSDLPHTEYPLVVSTWCSGVITNFPMPEAHSPACDCVERATALLTEHATHSAA